HLPLHPQSWQPPRRGRRPERRPNRARLRALPARGLRDGDPVSGARRVRALAQARGARDAPVPRLLPHVVLHSRALSRRPFDLSVLGALSHLRRAGARGVDSPRAHLSPAPGHRSAPPERRLAALWIVGPDRPAARGLDTARLSRLALAGARLRDGV